MLWTFGNIPYEFAYERGSDKTFIYVSRYCPHIFSYLGFRNDTINKITMLERRAFDSKLEIWIKKLKVKKLDFN